MNMGTSVILAETPAPAFLMSIVKPLITLALFVPYARLTSGKLVKDADYYHLAPGKWSSIFLAFGAAALLAVVLTPWWLAGTAAQVLLLCAPCVWYVKHRNKNAKGVPKLVIYNLDLEKMAAARRTRSAQASVELFFQRKDRNRFTVPDQKDPAHAVYMAVQALLLPLLQSRWQRMDLALTKQGAAVSVLLDGVRVRRDPIQGAEATAVVDMLKTFAGLDPAERRKYQRGNAVVLRGDDKTTLTVSTMGSMQGESIRIDVERERQLTLPLDKAGMLEPQIKLLRETLAAEPKSGVVLVGARPGQGLTTLGYSLLGEHDAFTNNIKTIERRPERHVDGVEHTAFDPERAEYSVQLQTIIRRGPDVMMVAETGEPGVLKVIAAPGSRSTLIYALMPSDNPAELLAAWMKGAGDPANAAEALKLILVQRTLRRLCSSCRVAFQPTPDVMKMLAIPPGKPIQLYRQSGKVLLKDQPTDCPTCGGTGYMGLTGAFEVLAVNEDVRALLRAGDVKGACLQARRTNRCLSLQESALMKVRNGETSLDEVRRAFAPPAAPAGSGGQPAGRPAAAPAPAAPSPRNPQ